MKRQYLLALAGLMALGVLAPRIEHARSRDVAIPPAATPRVFAGSVVRHGDNFVLNDPSDKTIYMLDDAETASTYEGKKVKITGILDLGRDTIRLDRVEIIG